MLKSTLHKASFTRPGLADYGAGRDALEEGADLLFKQIKFGKIKIKIFKSMLYQMQENHMKI